MKKSILDDPKKSEKSVSNKLTLKRITPIVYPRYAEYFFDSECVSAQAVLSMRE